MFSPDIEFLNMKRFFSFLAFAFLISLHSLSAQSAAEDSIDVQRYALNLDMGTLQDRKVSGTATLTLAFTRNCSEVTLQLNGSVDSVSANGHPVEGWTYSSSDELLSIPVAGRAGDTCTLTVAYTAAGHVDNLGWGGLHLDNNLYYNLGVSADEVPHSFGRTWFPCRDNFYDKATYAITLTIKPGWSSFCSGLLASESENPDGTTTALWILNRPTPTYLVSVSAAPWRVHRRDYAGEYATYPATIGFLSQDSSAVVQAYDILDSVVPMYERCFGPYMWDHIGYIATPQGSMEHVNNIALVNDCMTDLSTGCQMVICHELGHAWFGNLITCATAGDMWINEGGASFCEEVAMEASSGKDAAIDYFQEKLSQVIRTTHHTDNGYRPLHDMPLNLTYGSTSYNKGALVWHSLRGYMGDELFYSSMRRLFSRCAFGNLDAAALRDSLSLYSGMDLNGFFDFHVFGPGFVDYRIESLSVHGSRATLTLSQQLVGTDRYARGNRVPVTFFSADQQQSRQLMCFDDSVATQTFDLPFEAAFAIVDYDHELANACTDGNASLRSSGPKSIPYAYFETNVSTGGQGWIHVGLHHTAPLPDTARGILRTTGHYWTVTGVLPSSISATGRFHYVRSTYAGSGASHLDEGFYERTATLDSIRLLYRANPADPWQAVSHKRTASSGTNSGYFTAPLRLGEYTLGVVDTARCAIGSPTEENATRLTLFPNPSHGTFTVSIPGYDKKFDLHIYDLQGRKVLSRQDLRDGDSVHANLPAGAYNILIKNNFISLQNQIIIQ